MMVPVADRALERLLSCPEPGVRYRTRVELLGEDPAAGDLPALSAAVADGPLVRSLLAFDDNRDAYDKWRGVHWRLVSLAELGLVGGHPAVQRALDLVLTEWASDPAIGRPRVVDGLVREH